MPHASSPLTSARTTGVLASETTLIDLLTPHPSDPAIDTV
jgi:hypothetical protein